MKNIRLLLLLGVGILIALVARDFLDSRKTRANVNVGEFATIPSELAVKPLELVSVFGQ